MSNLKPIFKLLAHRGQWSAPGPKANSLAALLLALQNGVGIETDLRTDGSQIWLAHDAFFQTSECVSLVQFCELYRDLGSRSTLALNIKCDGLAEAVEAALKYHSIEQYFYFDMSWPEHLKYLNQTLPTYFRVSEYEALDRIPRDFVDSVKGFWVDQFQESSFPIGLAEELLRWQRPLAIVSPELHKRPHEAFWRSLKGFLKESSQRPNIFLCTDFIPQALEDFSEFY